MTRLEKAKKIGTILDRLFPTPEIPLQHQDPYTLLIAVLLSAQSTDKKVNEITPRLFSQASTPSQMAVLPVSVIQSMIAPIGLAPQKARAIQALSQQLLDRHHGEVPGTFAELEALPGVGHKTASVVMAQAFGIPAFPVDTHIHRLAGRWGLSGGKQVAQIEADLKRLFDRAT